MKVMLNLKLKFLILIFSLIIPTLYLHATTPDKKQTGAQTFQVTKDQQIQQVKPKKPMKIKLHRNAKGDYSWDITGDNVDEITRADKRLRKALDMQ